MAPRSPKRTTQVRLDTKTAATLRKLAKQFGYTQKQGPTTGQGSVVQFLEAIAKGDLKITVSEKNRAENRADGDESPLNRST